MNDFGGRYIAEVTRLWTPLSLSVVPLHFMNHAVGQGGLLAAFSSQTRVFDGLVLFFEEIGACEARYVSKIDRVHTPRFQQIVTLKDWHLSRTLSQRIV